MSTINRHIGILGAGQLGRMLAMSGYPLAQTFSFYGLNHHEPAAMLGQLHTPDDSVHNLAHLIEDVDVITYESENTSFELIKQISATKPVYPGATSLYYSQHRGREKALFTELNIPCTPYSLVENLADLKRAVTQIGLPAILKTSTEGYDGKGQFVINHPEQIDQAWLSIGERQAILEGFVDFKRELSIIAVRNVHNEYVYYPLVENQHRDGILRLTLAPAQAIAPQIQAQAEGYIHALLNRLDHVGVLTLELFETEAGLVANEMAPRVHNSGHWTMEGAQTSQFENHIRAITGLPLGATQPRQSLAAMINIIGELGEITSALKLPNVHVHLYDKTERPGRKLGHINLLADSQEQLDQTLEQLQAWLN